MIAVQVPSRGTLYSVGCGQPWLAHPLRPASNRLVIIGALWEGG